jgi:hypothetical protein
VRPVTSDLAPDYRGRGAAPAMAKTLKPKGPALGRRINPYRRSYATSLSGFKPTVEGVRSL